MKKFLLSAFVLVLAIAAYPQKSEDDNSVSKSKTIEFIDSSGSLMKKEVYPLSKVKGVENEVLIITDVKTGKQLGCMRLTTEYKISSTSSYTYIGTLDYDELDACISSLTYIRDELLPTSPEVYTEIQYKTLDNLIIGAYCNKGKWKMYVYTKGNNSKSAEFFDDSNISSLIAVMKQAQGLIAEKIKDL